MSWLNVAVKVVPSFNDCRYYCLVRPELDTIAVEEFVKLFVMDHQQLWKLRVYELQLHYFY